jgi:hypothetical protein
MEIAKEYAVENLGEGWPDHSRVIAGAKQRPGLLLKSNQRIKLFVALFSDITNIATTLVGAHLVGAVNLTVADASGFWIGAPITVDLGGPNEENHVVQNIVGNVITIVTGLVNGQGGGTTVVVATPTYPWVVAALASGATAHAIDMETGVAMPYILPAGYTLSLIGHRISFDQDNRFSLFLDGSLILGNDSGGGIPCIIEEIVPLSTALIDPTAISPHVLDSIFTNLGGAALHGGTTALTILEAVGTPPFPTTKTTMCPFCGNKQDESVHATKITCSNCHRLYLVCDFTDYRGGP